jgi:predicted transcriptional regulator
VEANPNDEAFQEAQSLDAMIISAIREMGQATKKNIVEHTGAKATSVANVLTKLKNRHVVKEAGMEGKAFIYRLTDEGE